MSSPFPLRPSVDYTSRSNVAFNLTDESTTAILDVLSNAGARSILRTLASEPATTSDLADDLDMSIQNVQYHLERLRETELVTEVDTWYSSRGREMSVYALTTESLEINIASTRAESPVVRQSEKT